MRRKLTTRQLVAVASMLFGLFFGAGNLIFPVHMGQLAGNASPAAIVGFIITGVGLPLLGVAAMGVSGSDSLQQLSSRVGKKYSVFFTCALYLTIGPCFAIPRCATVSYTVGLEPLLGENVSALFLLLFTAVFFALVLFFSLRPGKILTWIGKIINPIFLVFLAILIFVSLFRPMGDVADIAPDSSYETGAFFQGFLEGYNTMDALAALAFGIIIIDVIRSLGIREPGDVAASTVKSGFFSCLLMAIIYALITVMGAMSRGILSTSENGGIALAQIASHYFGSAGQILLAVTVFLACLKTSIGLVTSCARTFNELFSRISYRVWTVIFSVFSLLIANLGLTALIAYSVPVLMFLYPLAITLILLSLFGQFFDYSRSVFLWVTILTGIAAFMDFLNALPAGMQSVLHTEILTSAAGKVLPFFSLGLGWICPAILGFVIGLLIRKKSS